ncbi:MAG: class I SAM-dependent DNA methyltransferase [Pseudomonadota bacterium]
MVDADVKSRLWEVANNLWANTGLRPSQFSVPVLGLIFLRFAETSFASVEEALGPVGSGGRRVVTKDDYKRQTIYLPDTARWRLLSDLPEDANLGQHLNDAMRAIEEENEDLAGALPKTFTDIPNDVLISLMRSLAPVKLSGDAFGKVYEYFLGKFAMAEGQKGGVFFTPESIVDLIVEIIEPYKGRILDPTCGSGGMFVHSAEFASRAKDNGRVVVYGVEKDSVTVNLNKMNLATHGLTGDIRNANSFYNSHVDLFPDVAEVGGFDFVMANPPFNVSGVDKERLAKDERFPFGLPSNDNANYLFIQMFHSALNETGRAGFVMANSAADARGSEAEIRRKLIETGEVDVIVSVGPKMFITVALPCTLWFFDRAKPNTDRVNQVLFLDARKIFEQVTRAHRRFTNQQTEFLANVVRLWRDEELLDEHNSAQMLAEYGFASDYIDVPGLCKSADRTEIESRGWSLNPSRYVGAAATDIDVVNFETRMTELIEVFDTLTSEARELEAKISENATDIIGRA